MFILFPLSHEESKVQRYPYITVGIIALNVLLFILTLVFQSECVEDIVAKEKAVLEFYMNNPGVEIPEDKLEKMSPETKYMMETLKKTEEIFFFPGMDGGSYGNNEESGEEADRAAEAEEEMERLLDEYDAAVENQFYRVYGHIPARGGWFTMFSSMFLHGGWLHIIFNMFFLYLSGCNIEDIWGRVIYPVFYLIGGLVAVLMHVAIHPASNIPYIGASGAIAAVMGAFAIRMYKTKIYFAYLYTFSLVKFRRGTFHAPTYLVLGLWLLQQFWNAWIASYTGNTSVAFWAHIGGFLFGASVALVFKLSGFEKNVLAPAIDKKVNLADTDIGDGSQKLDEGDLDGAVADFRKAIVNDPDNALAHSRLSEAYFMQGKNKVALIEFNRAVDLCVKMGGMDVAIDECLGKIEKYPEAVLPPSRHLEIADAIREKEMYEEAAAAYKRLGDHLQKEGKPENSGDLGAALTAYGDICMEKLKQPKEAFMAYKTLLKLHKDSPDKTDALRKKALIVKKAIELEKKAKQAKKPPVRNKPDIPMEKRIRIVEKHRVPGKYGVTVVTPKEANKVLPAQNGLDLKRLSEEPLVFDSVNMILAFQIQPDINLMFADFFVSGESRPYRINSKQIPFAKFISKPAVNAAENFRRFLLQVISNIDSVYVDQATMTFLKTRKMKHFPDTTESELYAKKIWRRFMGETKLCCSKCSEVYWIDRRKIPPAGTKLKCKKCSGRILTPR